jgi:chromosome segregation protein
MRAELWAARLAAQSAQQAARELALQVESRRSSFASLTTTVARVEKQLETLELRRDELAAQLANGEAPLTALQTQLELALNCVRKSRTNCMPRDRDRRAGCLLRERDAVRAAVEQRVEAARQRSMMRAGGRAGAVRREGVAEQLAATQFEFAALVAQLAPEASVQPGSRSSRRRRQDRAAGPGQSRGDRRIQGAIRAQGISGPAMQGSDRCAGNLESAMRKIDRETRSRFQDTFDRVNAGLKEKFPRLFGGGHAYLELEGEDSTSAGVSVMARPPGKRNSTISQLSGGEKALTAVAWCSRFSI